MRRGLETLILISDDSDFVDILRFASRRNLQTIVIGDLMVLSKHADISFSWDEVASGRAQLAAAEAHKEWTNKAALIRELEDDSYMSSEQEDSEFTTVRSRLRISTFSEEEFFDSDDDVDDDDEAFDDYSDDEEESAFEDFSPWSRRAAGDINKVY